MKPEELKELIDEAVKSAVEPLQTEIEALKAKEEETVDDNDNDTKDEAEKAKAEEEEAFKSKVLEKLEQLETRVGKKSAAPKSLKGQDGDNDGGEAKKSLGDRDLFGRKRIHKEVE